MGKGDSASSPPFPAWEDINNSQWYEAQHRAKRSAVLRIIVNHRYLPPFSPPLRGEDIDVIYNENECPQEVLIIVPGNA